MCQKVIALTAFLLLVSLPATSPADIIVELEYSTDTTGFFGVGSEARASLEAATGYFQGLLGDDLDAIVPTGSNLWGINYSNPATGTTSIVLNPTIPNNTLRLFVGARDLGGSILGEAGPGTSVAFGTPGWKNTVASRGEGNVSGSGATDVGPWGGSLAVDIDSTWNLNHTQLPSSGEVDLFTVLLHELAHVVGFGVSDSWTANVSGGNFTGPASIAEFGGSVPLAADEAHWADGTISLAGGVMQEAAMDPTLLIGTRRWFTDLDAAGLTDIGWEVSTSAVPEPGSTALISLTIVFGLVQAWFRRARKRGARAEPGTGA